MRIERLTPTHLSTYRSIMLEAYAEESEAFTSTARERERLPLDWWRSRVTDDPEATELVYGAFAEAQLAGVAGLRFERRERTKHKASLFGMIVLREFRRRGIARALVGAVLDHARSTPGLSIVQLTVTEANAPALRLYESCGFRSFGTEPLAIRYGQRLVPLVHMWRSVEPDQ